MLYIGREKEHVYWSSFYSEEFVNLNNILGQVIDDSSIKDLVEQKNLNIRLVKERHSDASNVVITVFNFALNKKLYTVNYPGLNLTLFKDDEDKVVAYIDHHQNLISDDKKVIFECKSPFKILDEDFDYQYLKKQAKFSPKTLDVDTIKSVLIKNIFDS